jgi:hypothetical protein
MPMITKRPHYVNAPPKPRRHAEYGENGQPCVAPDLLGNVLPSNSYDSRLSQRSHSAELLEQPPEDSRYGQMHHSNQSNNSGNYETYQSDLRPSRPKSSIECFESQNTSIQATNRSINAQPTPLQSPSQVMASTAVTSPPPPHRPWSDFLQASSNNRNEPNRSTSSSSRMEQQQQTKKQPEANPEVLPAREESIQRLMQWKQRMLHSPLIKREIANNNDGKQINARPIASTSDQMPNRPPLPEEYNQESDLSIAGRQRSQSFGSIHKQIEHQPNRMEYSSDDEGKFEFFIRLTISS